MLRKLAEVLEKSGQEANKQSPSESPRRIHFLRQGEPAMQTSKRPPAKLLTPGAVWKMEVDLGRQLQFPQEICSSTLRPDVLLWSAAVKAAILMELTVPWEEGLEAAYERKKAKYADLVAECRESGWSECEAVAGGGGSQRLCGQINITPAQGPGTTWRHTEHIHQTAL